MKLQIEVDENGKIVDSKFKTFGCGSAIASSSVATEWVSVRVEGLRHAGSKLIDGFIGEGKAYR